MRGIRNRVQGQGETQLTVGLEMGKDLQSNTKVRCPAVEIKNFNQLVLIIRKDAEHNMVALFATTWVWGH